MTHHEPPLTLTDPDPARYSPADAWRGQDASLAALNPHLDALEAQSVYIIREAFAKLRRLAMLWSVGKDSSVLLWLVRKAFLGHVPMPLLHIDTGYKLPQMITFRDALAARWGLQLRVGQDTLALDQGQTYPRGALTRVQCCARLKRDALTQLVAAHGFDALLLGIRRDEEGTRAKERVFSPRDARAQWNFRDQPPELWDHFKTDLEPGAHLRVHPLLHWSELDIWRYIDRERIPVVPLYFADDQGRRYRSLGCAPCTFSVSSQASTIPQIVEELLHTRVAERSTRAQDQESEDAFERLRASGYM